MRLSKQSQPVEFDRDSRRRQLWGRLLGLFAVIVIGATGLFFFPPAFFGPRVNQQWRPGCEEVQVSWLTLPSGDIFTLSHLPSEAGLLSEMGGVDAQRRLISVVTLVAPGGRSFQTAEVPDLQVRDHLHWGEQLYLVGGLEAGLPWPNMATELVILDLAEMSIKKRVTTDARQERRWMDAQLVSLPDGNVLLLEAEEEFEGPWSARVVTPAGDLGKPVALPLGFSPDSMESQLPAGLLTGYRDQFDPLGNWQDSEVMLVDPLTGAEVKGPRRDAVLPAESDQVGLSFRDSYDPLPGYKLEVTELSLGDPAVGFQVHRSDPDPSNPSTSAKRTAYSRLMLKRLELWEQLPESRLTRWMPEFARWNSPIEEVVQGRLTTEPPDSWEANFHKGELWSDTWPAQFELAQPVYWTAAATVQSGLNLFSYNGQQALLAQLVYPTPRAVNNGNGLLRLALLDETQKETEWICWMPLPNDFKQGPHYPRLAIASMPDGLLLGLTAANMPSGYSVDRSAYWSGFVPHLKGSALPATGLLSASPERVGWED